VEGWGGLKERVAGVDIGGGRGLDGGWGWLGGRFKEVRCEEER